MKKSLAFAAAMIMASTPALATTAAPVEAAGTQSSVYTETETIIIENADGSETVVTIYRTYRIFGVI